MKRFVLLLFGLLVSAYPQEKVFVWLKDKGGPAAARLEKESIGYARAAATLSREALQRRAKTSGDGGILTESDLPVWEPYIQQLESAGFTVVHRLKWFNAVSGYATSKDAAILRKLAFVDSVTMVRRLFRSEHAATSARPSAPGSAATGYSFSYTQLALSKVPVLHSAGITGSGVLVGVLDAGFDWRRHEALNTRAVIAEYDFVFGDSITADEANDRPGQHNHGTYVFSIVGGYKDSAMIGAAYGARFILAKTEDIRSEKHIEEDNYAAALQWMDSAGVDITSSSLGYNLFDNGQASYTRQDMNGSTAITTKAVEIAFSKGILTFTAAGNEGDDPWYYIIAPADGFNVIAVGSVGSDDSVSAFSSRGPTADGRIKPDVVAMGGGVYGAQASSVNGYLYNSGTSAATPIASGIGALLLSAHPYLSNVTARKILMATAGSAGRPNNTRGYGLLDAAAAVSYPVLEKKTGGGYNLHKYFFNALRKVQSATVVLRVNGSSKDTLPMIALGKGFVAALPPLAQNDKVEFTFSAVDTTGAIVEDPVGSAWYSAFYGSPDITVDRAPYYGAQDAGGRNYPNPFRNETTIEFYAAAAVPVTLELFNLLGEKVRTLKNGTAAPGTNRIFWNGESDLGLPLPSGVYICRMTLPSGTYSNKMVKVN